MIKQINFWKKTIPFVITLLLLSFQSAFAQNDVVVRGKVTSATDKEPLISLVVSEVDKNNRVVGGATTNVDGEFVLKVKSTDNKLVFAYLGFVKQEIKIGSQTTFNVVMSDNEVQLKEVVVKANTTSTGSLNIPTREVSIAMQTISTKEFEGIQVTNIEDALQGRISGLDIVSNSASPGSGMSMRIRGASTINVNAQPLIVVNGVPFQTTLASTFDFNTAREEDYADLLSVSPDDILEISVLKDAASTAIWGADGGNGVLMIKTKRGATGKPKVEYSLRLSTSFVPDPIPLLNGDEYTMLMKEEYLNPALNPTQSNIPEYSYVRDGSAFYWNYNNNTDWFSEITRNAFTQDHSVNVSGGGERGDYRISLGFIDQNGIVKNEGYSRFSNRTELGYNLSDRLYFRAELAYTFQDNDKSYDGDVWGISLRKMPNIPVYARDKYGNYTDVYFNIDQQTSNLDDSQKKLLNPVALLDLASYKVRSYRIAPTFRLRYDILDPNEQMLRFQSNISLDANSLKTTRFFPHEVTGANYDNKDINSSFSGDQLSNNLFISNELIWQPQLGKDHSLSANATVQTTINRGMGQEFSTYWSPGSSLTSVSGGVPKEAKSYSSESRGYAAFLTSHYAFKGKYILGFTLRRDVSSRFGAGNRVGYFPGISGKWIISDEAFMEPLKFISMLAIRPSWGITGNKPGQDYLHYSKYGIYSGRYIDMDGIYPANVQILDLRWEKIQQLNFGIDLALFDDRVIADLNFYKKHSSDLIFENLPLTSTSGYTRIPAQNGGSMNNDGWELNLNTPRIVKVGDFTMDLNFNLSNYTNVITELNPNIATIKGDVTKNGEYLRKIQENNPLGSFYGYRYKGVYQYNEYIPGVQENAPVARDANGNVLYDSNGNPKPMYFRYGTSTAYQFKGGDAIYEDINHDGNINELDVVYLGNANPEFNGGLGVTLRYKNFSVNGFFYYRYGNQIVNEARMSLEKMYDNDNQSIAVKWRWRKDGDVTEMPRALYKTGYNWLGSDRYVEDGSFVRFKYLTFNYDVPKKLIKSWGLTRLRFFGTINNIHVWTNYTGMDPEVGYATSKNDPFKIGFDSTKTPRSIDATFGMTVGF